VKLTGALRNSAAVFVVGCITARAPYTDGLMYEREYKPAEAIAAYRDALTMDPDFAPAHKRLAVLLKIADPAAALNHASKVLASTPDDTEMEKLRVELSSSDSPAPPPPDDRAAKARRTQFANARTHVDALLEDGKDDEALRFLDETVSRDPQACWVYERIQSIHQRRKDAAGAERARKALSACRNAR
jgi:tetratricopeptide (TPR) repeat protein